MSAASRPVSTGKTRTCPHCKATILESLSICPGCMHHLRFDSEAAKRQVAAAPALRVEGIIRHPPLEQPLEYFVIIAIRNDRGEEVTRQVVNVGALQAAEKRTFTLSVEVLPPQAPAPAKSTSSTGTFKAPAAQPAATVKPSTPSASPNTAAPEGTSGAAGSGSAPGSAASSAATGSHPAMTGSSPSAPSSSTAPTGKPAGGSASRPAPGSPAGAASRSGSPGSGPGTSGASGSALPSGTPPAGGNNPSSTASPPGGTTPAGQAKPGDKSAPAKPASGYILKPPSPGGPKRH
jgi:hypothetical protein